MGRRAPVGQAATQEPQETQETVREKIPETRTDAGPWAAVREVVYVGALDLRAGAHALRAEDAAIGVQREKGVRIIHGKTGALDAARRFLYAVARRELVQAAGSAVLAVEAVGGVLRQDHLKDDPADPDGGLGIRADDHALGGRQGAGG